MQIVAPSYSLKFFNWREHTYENCKKKEQTRIKKIVKNRFFCDLFVLIYCEN